MNKLALITGASSGIGLELAKVMAQNGHNVLLVARSRDKLEEIARGLEKQFHIKAHVHAHDLSQERGGEALFKALESYNNEVEVLVNNAGVGFVGPVIEQDLNKMREMININMTSLTELCRLYGEVMAKRRHGAILNVASTAAFQAGPHMAVYYATKAYVLSLTEALREELRPFNVQVSALCPGPTESEFMARSGLDQTMLFKVPWMMTSAEVARKAYLGLQKNQAIIVPGFTNAFGSVISQLAPRSVTRWIAGRINRNSSAQS